MYRQGDIFLVETQREKHVVSGPRERMVLAEGEVTGHLHEVQGDGATLYGDSPETMFLEVREPSELTHDEHSTILIEPGFYRVVRQREYVSPEEERMVID